MRTLSTDRQTGGSYRTQYPCPGYQ